MLDRSSAKEIKLLGAGFGGVESVVGQALLKEGQQVRNSDDALSGLQATLGCKKRRPASTPFYVIIQ